MRLIIFLITILPVIIFAYDGSYGTEYFNSAGLKASNISGYGIYYSRKLGDDFRAQMMGVVYYYERTKSGETSSIFNYDFGIEFHRFVYRTERMGIFWLVGGYYYYDSDIDSTAEMKTESITYSYNIGTGLGVEFYRGHFIYNFDIGYKFFEDDIDTFIDGNFRYNELKRVTKLGAGMGIGFLF